jgi:hypothetical protein
MRKCRPSPPHLSPLYRPPPPALVTVTSCYPLNFTPVSPTLAATSLVDSHGVQPTIVPSASFSRVSPLSTKRKIAAAGCRAIQSSLWPTSPSPLSSSDFLGELVAHPTCLQKSYVRCRPRYTWDHQMTNSDTVASLATPALPPRGRL